jgi:hypothetical protein
MKKTILFLCFLCISLLANAITIDVRLNKTLALFNYIEFVASHGNQGGGALMDSLRKSIDYTQEAKMQLVNFQKLNFGIMLKSDSEALPGHKQGHYNKDLIYSALSNSQSIEDFGQRIIGLLPHEEYNQLLDIMRYFEAFYDQKIWKNSEADLQNQVRIIKDLLAKQDIEAHFERIKTFYNSQWSNRIPLVINLCPVPGRSGLTQATPHVNVVVVQSLTKRKPNGDLLGVILHEMCHLLYGEQTNEVQQKQFDQLIGSKSPYRTHAIDWMDEALATAIGNGWIYKKLENRLDTSEWYNNRYINLFSKAIYPSVESYLEANKPIDQAWFDAAVASFGKALPNAPVETENFFTHIVVTCDDKVVNDFSNAYFQYFEPRTYSTYTPIDDATTFVKLREATANRLILLTENNESNYNVLRKALNLPKLNLKNEFYTLIPNEADGLNTLVINLHGKDRLQHTLEDIAKSKLLTINKINVVD